MATNYRRLGSPPTYPMGTPLDVPFEEREIVKTLGAKWAFWLRRWYVPENVPLDSFRRWLTWRNETRGPVSLEPFLERKRRQRQLSDDELEQISMRARALATRHSPESGGERDVTRLVQEVRRLRRALDLVWRPTA